MATSDPWTVAAWKIYGGGSNLKPTDRVGEFTLTAISEATTGKTAYLVNFADGFMPPSWKNCVLHPRGSDPFPPPAPLLPPWSTGTDGQWASAATAALEDLSPSMARLEGQLIVNSTPETLTLVRVDNASTDGEPLLAMHLTNAGQSGGIQPLDDGTAHGTH